jgi:hypothetical protein
MVFDNAHQSDIGRDLLAFCAASPNAQGDASHTLTDVIPPFYLHTNLSPSQPLRHKD